MFLDCLLDWHHASFFLKSPCLALPCPAWPRRASPSRAGPRRAVLNRLGLSHPSFDKPVPTAIIGRTYPSSESSDDIDLRRLGNVSATIVEQFHPHTEELLQDFIERFSESFSGHFLSLLVDFYREKT
jgi:hypothetical protein